MPTRLLRCTLFLLLVLSAAHLLLNGTLFLIALFAIGVLSYVIFGPVRFFMAAVLFAEICIGAGYYFLSWKGNGGLYNIAHNISVSAGSGFLVIAFVNIITVLLCVGLPYLLVSTFLKSRSLKTPVVNTVP